MPRPLLGDLLRRVGDGPGRGGAFRQGNCAAAAVGAGARLVRTALVDSDEPARALPLLLEASKDISDWLVQYHVATGLTRIVTTTDTADARAIPTAREALAIVLSARPGLANALALSARLDAGEDGSTTRALEDIRRAGTLSPGRADYIVLESFILMRRGEFAAARQLLVPLSGPSSSTRGAQQCPGDPRSGRAPRTERRRLSREARRASDRQRLPLAGVVKAGGVKREENGLPNGRARRGAGRGPARTHQLHVGRHRSRDQRGGHHGTLRRAVHEQRVVHQPPQRPAGRDRLRLAHSAGSRLRDLAPDRPGPQSSHRDRRGVPARPAVIAVR